MLVRVLLTGATGHVGSFVARRLVADGHEVRALVRDPSRLEVAGLDALAGETPGVEAVVGDVLDADSVRAAAEGCDAAVHSAAAVVLRRKDAELAHAVNVEGTRHVLDAADRAGLARVVHVSSVVALFRPTGPPMTAADPPASPRQPYSASKAAAHRLARQRQEAGQPVSIVTLGGIWGPDAPTLTEQLAAVVSLARYGVPVSKTGGMPVLDVRDAAQGIAAAADPARPTGAHLLAGHFLTQAEVADLVSEASGRRVRRYRAPAAAVVAGGTLMDGLMKVLPVTLPVTREGMQLLTRAQPVDNRPALEALDLSLRPVAETGRDTVGWLVQAGHLDPALAPAVDGGGAGSTDG